MTARQIVAHSTAVFLLLVTPFVVFLNHYQYPVLSAEVLATIGGAASASVLLGTLAARSVWLAVPIFAGLATLFLDIQVDRIDGAWELLGVFASLAAIFWLVRVHAAQLLIVSIGTMLLVTAVQLQASRVEPASRVPTPANAQLPFTLHLILDEHAGIDALVGEDASVARELDEFYAKRGFRLFGSAFSEYSRTRHSISQLLNIAPEQHLRGLIKDGATDKTVLLTGSAYFDRLVERGYAVRVLQSTYMDICSHRSDLAECRTYSHSDLRSLRETALTWAERAFVTARVYSMRTDLSLEMRQAYGVLRSHVSADIGRYLPEWRVENYRVGPLVTAALMDRLPTELASARRGEYWLAHLLLPHHPFVFAESCDIRPPSQWKLELGDETAPPDAFNTPHTRGALYRAYTQQLKCVYRKLALILDAIPEPLREDAVIILHGDHGSRITMTDWSPGRASEFREADYLHAFSTLFAVRAPGIQPGFDGRSAPITCLLKVLSDREYQSMEGLETCSQTGRVFTAGKNRQVTPSTMPRRPVIEP